MSTVVGEFIRDASDVIVYQSEADLERESIDLLRAQAYEFLPPTSEAQLVPACARNWRPSTASPPGPR